MSLAHKVEFMNMHKRLFVTVCGAIFFAFGFCCALMLFHYRSAPEINFVDDVHPQIRQEWEQLMRKFRDENQFETIEALENLKVVASAGPLFLAANDDFSMYFLIRQFDVPVIRDNIEYVTEIVVSEFPYVLVCPRRDAEIRVIARVFHYHDPHKIIIVTFFKNEGEDFFSGSYAITAPEGAVRFVDTYGDGVWDLLVDDISGRIFDSVGLCWVERNGTAIGCPIHYCPNCRELISAPTTEGNLIFGN